MLYTNSFNQVQSFALSLLLGVVLAAFFSIIKSFQRNVGKIYLYILFDVLFFLIAAINVFCFLLIFDYGFIRYYIILGVTLGFIIFSLTLGKHFETVFRFLFKWIFYIFSLFFTLIEKIAKFSADITKKVLNILKNTLQRIYCLLYNNIVKIRTNKFKGS